MKKILHINTTNSGGAFAAAQRWSELSNIISPNVKSKLLILEDLDSVNCTSLSKTKSKKWQGLINHAFEKLYFTKYQKNKSKRFQFSIPIAGISLYKELEIAEADIIHLHWINKGFFSIKTIEELLNTGKPIYWTMHDMWPFTGGCHHSRGCTNFISQCGNCIEYLKSPKDKDLSYSIWELKNKLLQNNNIHFIAPSQWLYKLAQHSSLLMNQELTHMPNPIDTSLFKVIDKQAMRTKYNIKINRKLVLFVAANLSNPYKGFEYFKEALSSIDTSDISLLLVGACKEDLELGKEIETISFGYVSDVNSMIEIYNLCDIFVTTSLEENLPNTIIESMACGLPSIAFNVGGIPDIIENDSNGFLIDIYNSKKIGEAISDYFNKSNRLEMTKNCINTVESKFSFSILKNELERLYNL